mgnify:CR=1 FL=1
MSEQIKEIPENLTDRVKNLEDRLEEYVVRFRSLELTMQYMRHQISQLQNKH